MPRSTLFPYTTLFRSRLPFRWGKQVLPFLWKHSRPFLPEDLGLLRKMPWRQMRSEERFSRNAEIDTLSLHDALPISSSVSLGEAGSSFPLETLSPFSS